MLDWKQRWGLSPRCPVGDAGILSSGLLCCATEPTMLAVLNTQYTGSECIPIVVHLGHRPLPEFCLHKWNLPIEHALPALTDP